MPFPAIRDSSQDPHFIDCDEPVPSLIRRYVNRLILPADDLYVTTERSRYAEWLGRRIPSRYGGAYCFIRSTRRHAVLINLSRIDVTRRRAVEIVVAEELLHMRDHLDGDHRRHSHHGYDRIAVRVAEMVGVSLEDVRSVLIPVAEQPRRYIYACPGCGRIVARKRRGIWSCGYCSPAFDRRFVLRLIRDLGPASTETGNVQ